MTEQQEMTVDSTPMSKPRRWPWVLAGVVCLFLLLCLATPAVIWDGEVSRTIHVRVIDNSSGRPIGGATVSLVLPSDQGLLDILSPKEQTELLPHAERMATTDQRGDACLSGQFGAGGGSSLFGFNGRFNVDGVLKISHPDYRPSEDLLQNRLGERGFSIRTKQLDVRVFLVPIPKYTV